MDQFREVTTAGFRQLRLWVLCSACCVTVVVLGTGWMGEYRSCLRQVPVRVAAQAAARAGFASAVYWERHGNPRLARLTRERAVAESRANLVSCHRLLPQD